MQNNTQVFADHWYKSAQLFMRQLHSLCYCHWTFYSYLCSWGRGLASPLAPDKRRRCDAPCTGLATCIPYITDCASQHCVNWLCQWEMAIFDPPPQNPHPFTDHQRNVARGYVGDPYGWRWRVLAPYIGSTVKIRISQFQDGERPAFWKSLIRHISATFWPILMKFGTVMHIGPQRLK